MGGMAERRLAFATGASALVHALALLILARHVATRPAYEPARVFPISLVGGGGGGGGAPAAPAPPAPVAEAAAVTPAPPPPATRPAPTRTAKPAHPPTPEKRVASARPSPTPDASPRGGAPAEGAGTGPGTGPGSGGGSGGGEGGGDGAGRGPGSGDGDARVAYGANPRPPYPVMYQRLGMQGTVELDVVVAPDGRPASVRIAKSSGHPQLDELAADTVRNRYRFVPARRGGVPVEGRVTVPIRFTLEGEG